MTKRNYNIKGTQDFIVLAAIFFFLCLWAVKDAWFPSPKVLEKHPLTIELSFGTPGSINRMDVAEGDPVAEKQVLAELRSIKLEGEFAEAKKSYTESKDNVAQLQLALNNAVKGGASDAVVDEQKQSLADATKVMGTELEKVEKLREQIEAGILKAPEKGVIKSIEKFIYNHVEAGETVMVLDPNDHFYTFNKSLAIFSFIAFWVFLCLHLLAR